MKYICFETRSVTVDYFLDKMQFWEGFEIMKNSKYVDLYERTLLRELGYFILQTNSKKKVDITKYIPLPWDNKYRSLTEAEWNDEDFNTEWLEDYDEKMKEFEKRGAEMEEKLKSMKFESINLKGFYGRKKSNNN